MISKGSVPHQMIDNFLSTFDIPLRSHVPNTLKSNKLKVVGKLPKITSILRTVTQISKPRLPVLSCWQLKFLSDQVHPHQSPTGWYCWITVSRINHNLVLIQWNKPLVDMVAASR